MASSCVVCREITVLSLKSVQDLSVLVRGWLPACSMRRPLAALVLVCVALADDVDVLVSSAKGAVDWELTNGPEW